MSVCSPAEQALVHLLQRPNGDSLIRACYYDQDVLQACHRFEQSEEWQALKSIIGCAQLPGQEALDLGAGNGIASYALAHMGFTVTAVEPDSSGWVGYGALRKMVCATMLPITCASAYGEHLPFADQSYSLVFARQVLHHAQDLGLMLREVARLLQPRGLFIAAREHVIDDEASRQAFLGRHPLQAFTHSENAFPLTTYITTFQSVGLTLRTVLGPWDSVINHYPVTNAELRAEMRVAAQNHWGILGRMLATWSGWEKRYRSRKSSQDRTPGRLFTFVAQV